METSIISIINGILENGAISDTGLLLIIIILILCGYKYILKPIYDKVFVIPSLDNVKELVSECNDNEKLNIDELTKKLQKLELLLDSINDIDKGSYREILELKKDIESIKQILNQFQGHMMYSGSRRSSDFGNRELK